MRYGFEVFQQKIHRLTDLKKFRDMNHYSKTFDSKTVMSEPILAVHVWLLYAISDSLRTKYFFKF